MTCGDIITVKSLLTLERTSRVALQHGTSPKSLQAIHWTSATEYCQRRGREANVQSGKNLDTRGWIYCIDVCAGRHLGVHRACSDDGRIRRHGRQQCLEYQGSSHFEH